MLRSICSSSRNHPVAMGHRKYATRMVLAWSSDQWPYRCIRVLFAYQVYYLPMQTKNEHDRRSVYSQGREKAPCGNDPLESHHLHLSVGHQEFQPRPKQKGLSHYCLSSCLQAVPGKVRRMHPWAELLHLCVALCVLRGPLLVIMGIVVTL